MIIHFDLKYDVMKAHSQLASGGMPNPPLPPPPTHTPENVLKSGCSENVSDAFRQLSCYIYLANNDEINYLCKHAIISKSYIATTLICA